MSNMDINAVLTQLRALSAQAAGRPQQPSAAAGAPDFGKLVSGAISKVNEQQVQAGQAAQDFELGKSDLASVMITMQKAQVSFKAMTEVRNKLVQAYQDIMNMPI